MFGKLIKTYPLTALIIGVAFMLIIKSGSWGVSETSEARYAEISREMHLSGDWLHPRLLGIGHYHKPPLTYVITAFSFHLWGVNAFAVRFFLQLAVIFQMVLIYGIGNLLFKDKRTALISAIIYISFPAVLISTRALTTDAYLTTFALGAIFCWMKHRICGHLPFLYGFYLCLAFGFLTKGPLILVLPLIIVIGFNRYHPTKSNNLFHHFMAFIIFVIVGLSWFTALVWENNEFLHYFFVHHLYQRFTDPTAFNRSQPFWFYLLTVPVISFPWFVLIVLQFIKATPTLLKTDPIMKLLFLWVFPALALFSLSSSKLILYVLPVFPGIALASAYFLIKMRASELKVWTNIQMGYHIFTIAAILFTPLAWPKYGLTWQVWLLSTILTSVLICATRSQWLSAHLRIAVTAMGFTLGLAVITTFIFSNNPGIINSTQNLAAFITENNLTGRPVLVYNTRLPSIAFHLQREIVSLADGHRSLNRETQFESNENWRRQLLNLKSGQGQRELKNYIDRGAVLITAGKLPENSKWVTNNYTKAVSIDKWKIFYDP